MHFLNHVVSIPWNPIGLSDLFEFQKSFTTFHHVDFLSCREFAKITNDDGLEQVTLHFLYSLYVLGVQKWILLQCRSEQLVWAPFRRDGELCKVMFVSGRASCFVTQRHPRPLGLQTHSCRWLIDTRIRSTIQTVLSTQ